MTTPWAETTLPTILSRYPPENIFNADEFRLFYQCLPNKTLHLKGEKCSGGKHSKDRLNGLAAGNAYGERLQMFALGKSVLKVLKLYLADTVLNIKVGCLESFSKIGYITLMKLCRI